MHTFFVDHTPPSMVLGYDSRSLATRDLPMAALKAGSTYAEATKQAIVREVYRLPGRGGKEIAAFLGLERSRVNSFLYNEGKNKFGLIESQWRWFPPNIRRKPLAPTLDPSNPPVQKSVCSALADLSLTQATLKIRSLNLDVVELAFAEDDFFLLDDTLKAELSIRRAEVMALLQKNSEIRKARNRSPLALILFLIVIAFASGIFLRGLGPRPSYQSEPPTLNQ